MHGRREWAEGADGKLNVQLLDEGTLALDELLAGIEADNGAADPQLLASPLIAPNPLAPQQLIACPACNGTGRRAERECYPCRGIGQLPELFHLNIASMGSEHRIAIKPNLAASAPRTKDARGNEIVDARVLDERTIWRISGETAPGDWNDAASLTHQLRVGRDGRVNVDELRRRLAYRFGITSPDKPAHITVLFQS